MSFDVKRDTITVNDVKYDVERRPNRSGSGEETLVIRDFDVETDDWIYPFEGLSGTLGYDHFDTDNSNPRQWDNLGHMAVSYPRNNLGDEDISKINFDCPNCYAGQIEEDDGVLYPCEKCNGKGTLDPVTYFKRERGARVVIPLTVYEHSGITMHAGNVTLPWDSDRWDTSFVGFIYDDEDKRGNMTDEEIERALRAEVKTYAAYLEGDITYWAVDDPETNFVMACGGYVGDHEGCEHECFEALEQAIGKRLAEIAERAAMAARDIITV